ncbi:hypothetical protein GQ53DRAFT_832693 [Thozetella sp. PMI_491]|nr:hypothetical protein GQ53DRAFT_832693 [Thozetella sp. PMI_491]
MSLTYYAPSITSSTTTSWIPLTTQYGNHGSGASNFLCYYDSCSAWVPNDAYRAWTSISTPLPSQMTALWVLPQYLDSVVYSIGPFAACPVLFSTVTTSYSSGTSMTVCCPSDFNALTLADVILCTSMYTSSILTFVTEVGTEISLYDDVTITGTIVTSSFGGNYITYYGSYIATSTLTSSMVITAPAISGFNIAQSSVTGDLASSPTNTSSFSATGAAATASCDFPTSAIAGLAVTSFIGLVGIFGFAAAACLFLRSRRQPPSPPPVANPAGTAEYYNRASMLQSGGAYSTAVPAMMHQVSPPISTPSPEQQWSPVKISNAELSASPRPQDQPMIPNFDYNHIPPHHYDVNDSQPHS